MEKLHVCYTTNEKYFNPMVVSLYSLLENNQEIEIFIHMILENCSKEHLQKIEKIVSLFPKNHLLFYHAEWFYKAMENVSIPKWRGTNIANVRLFLEHIPKRPEQLLYLDSDTIVVGNLKELASYKQRGPLCAVLDRTDRTYKKELCETLENYYNSGVLLIDFNLWEKTRGSEKIRETLEKKYPLCYPDQDLLNIAFEQNIETLLPNYNMFPFEIYYDTHTLCKFYKNCQIDFYKEKEIRKAKKEPKILHAMDFFSIRPWQQNRIHPFQDIYLEYLKKVDPAYHLETCANPLATINPHILKIINYGRVYTPKEVRQGVKRILKK